MANKTDNSLILMFRPIIQQGLIDAGFTNAIVKQSNQPTAQGTPLAPTVYFFKLFNRRYGFLGRQDTWNELTQEFVHTETQYYETSFQIMALVLQNPADIAAPTASDLVNEVASIMQSDRTRDILQKEQVGILRVTDISNPYFVDDRDNFEASPSFDFTLTYANTRDTTSPKITPPILQNIHGV